MIKHSKTLALLAPGLLLAGCNMAPHYVRPDLPVAPSVSSGIGQGAGADTAQIAQAQASDAAPMAWKDYFTDARLRAVIGLSLENNRDLRVAVAHIAQARARYKVQGADLFPTISAGASGDIAQVPSGLSGLTGGSGGSAGGPANSTRYNLYRGQLGVSAWEIDLFGRVRNLTQAAQEEYFASIDNRAAAQVSLVSEVANAWLQLAADREQLAIARDTHAAFAQTLGITQDRARMGVASDLDLQQARTSFEQARADIARLTTTVAQDRNALDLLVGTPVGDAMLPEGLDTTEATIGQLPGGLASSVLLKRPDVSSAEHDLRSANANIGAARAAFFPQISLTAAVGTMSMGFANLFRDGSLNWSASPSATLPIFDMGKNINNLRYAKATRDAMVATYEKAIQTAFRETADALARRETIGTQLDAQQKREGAAHSALTIAQARYKEGVDPFLTTLDSERTYYAARQDLVSVRLERQTNAVELFRALGGGV